MSYMKDWAMELSESMGFDGEITKEVVTEGERRLRLAAAEAFKDTQEISECRMVSRCLKLNCRTLRSMNHGKAETTDSSQSER